MLPIIKTKNDVSTNHVCVRHERWRYEGGVQDGVRLDDCTKAKTCWLNTLTE